MKKISRKILSVLLAVIMVLSIIPMAGVSSFAATSGDFSYAVLSETDKTCEITDYTGSAANLTIPSAIGGYTVTGISYLAFSDCASLTSITIPDSVTSIGGNAFYGCASLTSIIIPDEVMSIGSWAFENTAYYNNENNWENGVLYIGKHLIDVKEAISGSYAIKIGTKTIADCAFQDCTSLTSVTIPNSVTSIGFETFADCTLLTSVAISNGVTDIGYEAFVDCESLKSVTIPKSVREIGEYAFGYIYDTSYYAVQGARDAMPDYIKVDGFTIYGYTGSAAETYAKENEFKFIALDGAADISMHRLYNENSGEHFYTSDINEKTWLVSLGWTYEGIGWNAPETSSTPVYRLYNQDGGEHHYTTDIKEKNWLVSLGWTDEGIGWYSDDAQGVPLYRQYNPNAFANNHNYTTDKGENDWLVSLGWKAEGIGWYGVA